MASRRSANEHPGVQPMGWPSYAYQNAARQAQQEATRQRERADRLAAANRRLLAHGAAALTTGIAIGIGLMLLALVLGFAAGVGLVRLVTP
jgi:hypothetical protein